MTPTEAMTARENGVQIVKVFPAGVLGPNYIKQLKGPLSQIDMMAVGGVNLDNFSDFIKVRLSMISLLHFLRRVSCYITKYGCEIAALPYGTLFSL